MASSQYPVVREQALELAQRRMFSRTREINHLPKAEPGTVLVFEVATGHVAFTERRHLRGREDLVVDAVSVSLVRVRPQSVVVQLSLPSRSAADEFSVLVEFRCCVEDPEVVAAAGLTDVIGPLRAYLRQDTSLMQLATDRSIEQINDVRQDVHARINAYYQLRPPRIEGVSIRLQNIRVLTPEDLKAHEKSMRDKAWQHKEQDLENWYEDHNADRLRAYFEGGPTKLAGLAASRDQLDLSEATNREYEQLERKRDDLIKLFNSLPEGARDTMAIDAERIINSVFSELLPPARLDELEQPSRTRSRIGPAEADHQAHDREQSDG